MPPGEMGLSRVVEEALAARFAANAPTQSTQPAFDPQRHGGLHWYCPGCGKPLNQKLECEACGKHMRDLVVPLVELHPHRNTEMAGIDPNRFRNIQSETNRQRRKMAVLPDMIGIVVEDMRQALAFYRLLGLAIPEGVEHEPYVELITSNGYRISWNTVEMTKGIDPNWQKPTGQGISLAFLCDSPAEVDAVYERLVNAEYASYKGPWDAFWGQRYAIVIDPDGNHVDLFAPIPA